jgi:hypothetical protein
MLLDILKRYEITRDLRTNKIEYIVELKRVFDEILVLNRKLRTKLPKVPEHPTLDDVPKSTKKVKNAPANIRTHMDILEDELAKIEERLEGLK